jgi:hypothetical protein
VVPVILSEQDHVFSEVRRESRCNHRARRSPKSDALEFIRDWFETRDSIRDDGLETYLRVFPQRRVVTRPDFSHALAAKNCGVNIQGHYNTSGRCCHYYF